MQLNASVFATGEKTGATVNRAALRRIKGHGGLLTALCALNCHFDALTHSRRLSSSDGCESLIFRLLARLTTLGFVLETFIVEEHLLTGRPNKYLVTVHAFNAAILELRFGGAPFSVNSDLFLNLLHKV
ncbi:MAG: hypothetical protein WKF30_12030 [Pyrinomonadaceae bacterium]